MKLIELEAQFFRVEQRIEDVQVVDGDQATWRERGCPTKIVTRPQTYFITVASFAEADGVRFLCPKCFVENKGKVGTHGCHVYFAGRTMPDELNNGVRWQASGSSLEDLSTTPSILLIGGCAWHGYITNGEATLI